MLALHFKKLVEPKLGLYLIRNMMNKHMKNWLVVIEDMYIY
jgi:hypothetical protein